LVQILIQLRVEFGQLLHLLVTERAAEACFNKVETDLQCGQRQAVVALEILELSRYTSNGQRDRGAGRPTKKDRRDINEYTEPQFISDDWDWDFDLDDDDDLYD
jgi:hypothetical protein